MAYYVCMQPLQLKGYMHNIPFGNRDDPQIFPVGLGWRLISPMQEDHSTVSREGGSASARKQVSQWRIIACESSDYRHIVHDDGFVWLMFVHERFSASEQTLNSQNHGVHYMAVITRLTCNNSILLTRNSPDWQTYRDDTADDTVLALF